MIPQPEPRIARFEEYAYGMFVHWGLYSLLGKGEWIRFCEKIDKDEYSKLAGQFKAEKFDGARIASIARQAGMKYICLTTRHHDGFSLYDTKGLCEFDAVHSAAGRDLVEEFVKGCRSEGIIPFFYHTTLDWYQESFEKDFDSYLEYLRRSVEVLCKNYGPVGGFWFDGNWSKPEADWKEDALYATIRRHQPEAIIVNNTGLFLRGKLGHPEIDSVTYEQGRPEQMNREGMSKYIAAEMCQTMNQHWGIGANDYCYMSPKEIIDNLCACRRAGANYLLNVGPTAAGEIPEYESAALKRAGQWVAMHADAIYKAKPCGVKAAGRDFVLEHAGKLYIFVHDLNVAGPGDVSIGTSRAGARAMSGVSKKISSVTWMDNGEKLDFTCNGNGLLAFDATAYPYGSNLVVRVARAE